MQKKKKITKYYLGKAIVIPTFCEQMYIFHNEQRKRQIIKLLNIHPVEKMYVME